MPWIRACATSADGHSLFGGDPLPWLQLEMSRALYLAPPWFDRATLSICPEPLSELRDGVLAAIASLPRLRD